MQDLVHDLQLPIGFEHCEQISEPVALPVIEFKPNTTISAIDDCTLVVVFLNYLLLYFDRLVYI